MPMRNMFKKPRAIMLYPERAEFQELENAGKDFRKCRVCGAVYCRKFWNHAAALDLGRTKKTQTLWITRSPACKIIADRQYEGVLTIENIPKGLEHELRRLIQTYAKRVYELDSRHRIIALTQENRQTWKVTTAENQLADKLAQKIKGAFDRVKVKISYSDSEQPDNVERGRVTFQPLLFSSI